MELSLKLIGFYVINLGWPIDHELTCITLDINSEISRKRICKLSLCNINGVVSIINRVLLNCYSS